MQQNTDHIQTTHVGSLVRPPELVEFMRARLAGEDYDEEEFRERLDVSINDVVGRQAAIGIDIVSDGEYGKTNWYRYVLERITGFDHRPIPGSKPRPNPSDGNDYERFKDFYDGYHATLRSSGSDGRWFVTGPIEYIGQAAVRRDIDTLKGAVENSGAPRGFLPVVAPASVLSDLHDEHYGDERTLYFALAEALRHEYRTIADSGLMVQIDDAWLAAKYDRMVPPGTLADYRKWAEIRIDALNHALEGIPRERTRYHICWGSWNGPHTTDVELKDIVDMVLSVEVGGYALEMANPRHEHEWQLWKDVKLPEGCVLSSGRHQSHDKRRRTSRPRRRADRPVGRTGRPGECSCRHRLRLRAGRLLPAGSPVDHVGQAGISRGGRTPGDKGTLALTARATRSSFRDKMQVPHTIHTTMKRV